jgi:hypothetical protein
MPVANVHIGLSDTELTVMTEAEVAWMRAKEGDTVVQRDGRHWWTTFPGFYQPIHLLARLKPAEIRRPALLWWGYRAALIEEDACSANGSLPVYLLSGIDQFTEGALARNRRSDLRRCRREVELCQLREPSLLMEQGYRVFMSAVGRLGYWRPMTEAAY